MLVSIYVIRITRGEIIKQKQILTKIPPDIKILNDRNIHKILKWRTGRIEKINQERKKNGKPEIEMTLGWYVTGWGLEIDLTKHEIIERYL